MLSLKNAEYRHDIDGKRVVEIMLYTDDLPTLPTNPAEIPGIENDDIVADGSTALNMQTGDVAMFDGTAWNIW